MIHRTRLRTWLLLSAVALGGCVPGAGSGSAPASPTSAPGYRAEPPADAGGTLVLADWEAPAGFNVLNPATDGELRAAQLIFAPLWGLDARLKPYPDLVREVPTPENGGVKVTAAGTEMTIRVRLIPGLRWSDGAPLNADDVIFTWRAMCDPATQVPVAGGLERVQDMERRSDTELLWHLAPSPTGRCGSPGAIPTGVYGGYLQMGPALHVLPAHRLQSLRQGDWPRSYFARPDVVSGPFVLAGAAADRVVFNPNPGYPAGRSAPGAYSGQGPRGPFDHAPYLGQVVLRIYPSKDAELEALRGGAADLGLHLSQSDLAELQAQPRASPVSDPGLRDEFLNPNHSLNSATRIEPPWVQAGVTDRPLLEALALALDRQALARQAQGIDLPVSVSRGLFPGALSAFADAGLIASGPDLDGARRLLEQDGWKLSSPDPVRRKEARRLDFEVLGVCGSASTQRELRFLQDAWAQVGAAARTGCRPRSQLFGDLATGGVSAGGAFDMSIYSNSWGPDPDAWASFAASDQVPAPDRPGAGNWNRCRDPELDGAFAGGASALKPSARREAYQRAQREWLAYHCTIPLFEWPQVRQVSGLLHNFRAHAVPGLETWNSADWWLRR